MVEKPRVKIVADSDESLGRQETNDIEANRFHQDPSRLAQESHRENPPLRRVARGIHIEDQSSCVPDRS